jgi:hypothetical protein
MTVAYSLTQSNQYKKNKEEGMTRYSNTGNDDDGYVVDELISGGRGRESREEDADFRDAIKNIGRDFKNLKEKHKKTLANAYKRSMQKRQAKARQGNLDSSAIQIRREGILARPNPQDRKRSNTNLSE